MERNLLFRGQHRRGSDMVDLYHNLFPSVWVYGGVFLGEGDYSIIYGGYTETSPIEKYMVYSKTVGQYTGINDRRNKMIFTGDIVKISDGRLGVIKFGKFFDNKVGLNLYGYYWFNKAFKPGEGLILDDTWTQHIIIGNIFDNHNIV